MSSVLAFGGGQLIGDRLLRFVYVDESGNNQRDRHTVVAGVMVNADAQLVKLEDALDALVTEFIREEDRYGFYFRGSDIYGGNGYFKGKSAENEEFPFARRLDLLRRLALLTTDHRLPVLHGHSDTEHYQRDESYKALSPTDAVKGRLMMAHAVCVLGVEHGTRITSTDEVVQLVVENSAEMRQHVSNLDKVMRHPRALEILNLTSGQGLAAFNLLPLQRIRNSVHFAAKEDSRVLQLADVCAYIIRGNYVGGKNHKALYEVLEPSVPPPLFSWAQ